MNDQETVLVSMVSCLTGRDVMLIPHKPPAPPASGTSLIRVHQNDSAVWANHSDPTLRQWLFVKLPRDAPPEGLLCFGVTVLLGYPNLLHPSAQNREPSTSTSPFVSLPSTLAVKVSCSWLRGSIGYGALFRNITHPFRGHWPFSSNFSPSILVGQVYRHSNVIDPQYA
jgi:hypothetical protein